MVALRISKLHYCMLYFSRLFLIHNLWNGIAPEIHIWLYDMPFSFQVVWT